MSEQNENERVSREVEQAKREVDVSLTALEIAQIQADAENSEEANEMMEEELARKERDASIRLAQKLINQETPSRFLLERPSWGQTEALSEIHTRHAYALLVGRNGPQRVTGLYAAAKQVRTVVSAYRKGCPFAAQMLLQLEQDLNQTNELFVIKEAEIRKLMQNSTRVKMKTFVSNSPARVDIQFASPYSYHMLDLLLRFDDMVRILLPYYQIRMIEETVFYNTAKELARHQRRIMCICDRYFYVGPEAVEAQDELYLAGVNQMGELNPDILSRKTLPYLVSTPQAFVR